MHLPLRGALSPLTMPGKLPSTLPNGLVSYWKLDEASGTRSDSVGSNHLTDNNTVTQAVGKIGNAAEFVLANSEYLSISDASQSGLDVGTLDWSISAWIYPTSTSAGIVACKRNISSGQGWMINMDSNRRVSVTWHDGTGAGSRLSSSTMTLNAWNHLVLPFDRDGAISGRLNGSAIAWFAGSDPSGRQNSWSSTTAFTLGTYLNAGPTVLWDGRMDEIAFYSRVLTTTEQADLYNSGNGLAYPFS